MSVVRVHRNMKLSGWHRLWIVVCAIYLAIVSVFVALNWPNPERFSHRSEFYESLASESREKIVESRHDHQSVVSGDVIRVEMPNRHVIPFSREFSEKELEKVAAEYWSIVKKNANEKKIELMVNAGLWWLIPCFVLYVLGWSIGWIYRGFKSA